jgi:hypothetical protein
MKIDKEQPNHIVRVCIFWICLFIVVYNFKHALTYAFKNIRAVTRFLSTCGPEDGKFDVDSTLKQQIYPDQLEKVVFTIENKLSLGIIEKR